MPVLLSLLLPGAATGETAAEQSTVELRRAQMLSFNCLTCHAAAPDAATRPLHRLDARTIRDKLHEYQRDVADATAMHRIARGYSDEEIRIIADYLGRQFGEALQLP